MIKRNIILLKWYYFFWRFRPLSALLMIYFYQITQSYATAAGVFSIFNIAYSIVKIPGGLLSDEFGRRKIIIIAGIFLVISFILMALAGNINLVWILYLSSVLWGTSEALLSGATEALMFETTEELKIKNGFKGLYAKSMFSDQTGCAFGALFATCFLSMFSLRWLAWFSVLPSLCQLGLSLFIVEPKKTQKKISMKSNLFLSLKEIWHNKKLRFYVGADILFSTLGDTSHRFEVVYFQTLVSDWIITLTRFLKHICGMLGSLLTPLLNKLSSPKIYFGSITINLFIRISGVMLNNICTPFVNAFINFFYVTASSAKADILQNLFSSESRATSRSIILFIKGLLMALVMFLVGIFSDMYGPRMVMVLFILIRVLILGIICFMAKKHLNLFIIQEKTKTNHFQ